MFVFKLKNGGRRMTKAKKTEQPNTPQENQKEQQAEQNKAPNDSLNQENEKLQNEIKDLTKTLQRLQAEFENYRKRCERESQNIIKLANEELIKDFLIVLDNFELALKNPTHKDEFYKGMELIYSQIITTLENNGLEPIKTLGGKFDPRIHEALLVEETEQEPNTITEELQKGYSLYDKVIRPAKVKISKKKQ
jgi:molecular chaperone GrpE